MKEALSSYETSVLTRVTWRNIPKDVILHSHRRENLKSYRRSCCSGRSRPLYRLSYPGSLVLNPMSRVQVVPSYEETQEQRHWTPLNLWAFRSLKQQI
jgi:hypothetical protein